MTPMGRSSAGAWPSTIVFGHEANGTSGTFGRDLKTNKLTLLTLNLTAVAKIQSPAFPYSFVFPD